MHGNYNFLQWNNLYVVVSCAKSQKVSKGYFVETVDDVLLIGRSRYSLLFDPPGPICWQLCLLGKCRPSYIIVLLNCFLFVVCFFIMRVGANQISCKFKVQQMHFLQALSKMIESVHHPMTTRFNDIVSYFSQSRKVNQAAS